MVTAPVVGQQAEANSKFSDKNVSKDGSDQLRVMSFNIRYGLAKDGDNSWPNRDSFVADVAKEFHPDLLGIQEAMGFQADYLKQHMPDWKYFGTSRDANHQGEQCGIFVRLSRFEILNDGQFWLSESPDTKFSKSWDSSLPRIATWVHLKDKVTGTQIVYLNTHFDHRGAEARLKSAQIIRKFVDQQKKNHAIIVTGDFNCDFQSRPYDALLASERLQDTWRLTHPTKTVNDGTFNGFQGKDDGARIDWVLCSPSFQVIDAAIVKTSQDGKYPSDHFPVTAILK
ncbi:MAG: endonuclease/exonuclease/phosphatase family protein [Fuerstiella sp.]